MFRQRGTTGSTRYASKLRDSGSSPGAAGSVFFWRSCSTLSTFWLWRMSMLMRLGMCWSGFLDSRLTSTDFGLGVGESWTSGVSRLEDVLL